MKLGDRFYRPMSEWRCAKFRDRHLATEENAYELYWFNRLDHFHAHGLDFEAYSHPAYFRSFSYVVGSYSTTETFGNLQKTTL